VPAPAPARSRFAAMAGAAVAIQAGMPIAPFPHRYSVTLEGEALAAEPRPPIRTGTPSEFGGTDAVWGPEHLLVGAALACLKTTFDAYAARDGVRIHAWRGAATGVLAKGHGGPVFTSIDLEVELVTDPGDEARAEAVLATAERSCIVSRALSAPVHVTGKVTAAPGRAAG
jgi:organic hydroperoxide reductase OsmC/OhrA